MRVDKLILALLLFCLSPVSTFAGEKLPVELFFKNLEFSRMVLSPNGRYLGAIVPKDGKRALAVLELETMKGQVAMILRNSDIDAFTWASNDRLLVSLDSDGNESFGMYAVNRDGSNALTLFPPRRGNQAIQRSANLLDRLRNDDDHILITNNDRRLIHPDVYLVDINGARRRMHTKNLMNARSWVTDNTGEVRAAVADTKDPGDLISRVMYRSNADADWVELARFSQFDPGWYPVGFTPDNRQLWVLSNLGRNTTALYRYDPEKRQMLDMVFGHDEFDIEGAVTSPKDDRLLYVTYATDRPQKYYVDKEWQALEKEVEAALPKGRFNSVVSISRDESKVLYLSWSDRTPGAYYLLDREKNKLRLLAERAEWIRPEQMNPMEAVSFPARDGRMLHGYLTRPKDSKAKRLPLIVHPHGGPFGIRDRWGFDPEVQFLSNRGYAVLQINFRGSGGYGKSLVDAGYKQWGLKMQDDITDGVQWAIDQGIADPQRKCIYGASYGGFATMSGITREPDLYKCAVDYVGVVDLKMMVDYYRDQGGVSLSFIRNWFKRAVVDPGNDEEQLRQTSPIYHIDRIKVPVFVVHGENDNRVQIKQAKSLIRELKNHNVEHEVLIKDDEGHGFRKEKNKFELYKQMDAFFKKHL
ncbi:MAG: S9 family peptidase [Gammaproteobacteria bacterium]|nr:S9 family peptidase [Gammaproteobacteria bacterium]